jgi:hypothetical protein
MDDPAIAEIRGVRAKLAETCDGDVARFGAMIAEEERKARAKGQHRFVTRQEVLAVTETQELVFHDNKQ